MERQLLERMIGAGVLLIGLVVIVPAILDGPPGVDEQPNAILSEPDSAASDAPLRQHTIHLDRQPDRPPVAQAPTQSEPATKVVADPPAPEPQPNVEQEPEARAAPEPEKAPEPKVAVVVPPKVEPAPKPKPAPAPKPAADSQSVGAGWVVQLGSFSSRENAQGLVDKTGAQGFQSYLLQVERSGKTLYRVRVGPPRPSRDDATKLAGELQKAGFKGQVAQQAGG